MTLMRGAMALGTNTGFSVIAVSTWDDKLWRAGLMIQVHTASRCHSRGGECHMLESLYPLELQVNYCISGVPETT